jgi:hypothetical protein
MTQSEITLLREEIAKLREEIAVLRDSSNKHFDLFTTHIADQGVDISDLFNYVMPVLQKVYPGFEPSKKQCDEALNGKRAADRRREGDDEPL